MASPEPFVDSPSVWSDTVFASDLAGGLRAKAQGTTEPVTTLSAEPVRVSAR